MSEPTVTYDDIEMAFMFVNSQPQYANSALVSRATGQIFYISDIGDSDELPDDIDDPSIYVHIPHKNELDLGRQLAFDFVGERIPSELDRAYDIFRSKGAYSRFKGLLEAKGKLQEWYDYEQQHTEQRLRAWCAEAGIDFSA